MPSFFAPESPAVASVPIAIESVPSANDLVPIATVPPLIVDPVVPAA